MTKYFSLFALSACLVSLAAGAVDRLPTVSYQIKKIEFKENGRFDGNILLECDIKQLFDKAAMQYLPDSERTKSLGKKAKKSPRVHYEMELRVDKVAHVAGMPPPSPRPGGTEVGVTAFLSAQSPRTQLFLCRATGMQSKSHPTSCGRIEYCSNHVTKQIAQWLAVLPVPESSAAQ